MASVSFRKRAVAFTAAAALSLGAINVLSDAARKNIINAADTANYEWDTLRMGGAGFVSGIVAGDKEMYLRTDVGGVY